MCLSVPFSECQETADSVGRRAALSVCLRGPCAPAPPLRCHCGHCIPGRRDPLRPWTTGRGSRIWFLGWKDPRDGRAGVRAGRGMRERRGAAGQLHRHWRGQRLRTSYGRTGGKGEPTTSTPRAASPGVVANGTRLPGALLPTRRLGVTLQGSRRLEGRGATVRGGRLEARVSTEAAGGGFRANIPKRRVRRKGTGRRAAVEGGPGAAPARASVGGVDA